MGTSQTPGTGTRANPSTNPRTISRTRWSLAALTAGLVTAGVMTVSGTAFGAGAQATAVQAGTYTLRVTKSGMCMDVTGGSTASGALIQQWGCGTGQTNQEWTLTPNGSNQYTIQSVGSGMCLDVPAASTTSGVQLQQYPCGSGKTNQLWTLTAVGSTYQIISVNSGLCVSDANASTTSGTPIIQETCTTNTNKTWTLTAVGSPTPPPSGTTITVAADGSGDVTTLQAAVDKVPPNNTKPVTIAVKKGTYREIVTVPSNKPYVTMKGLGSGPSDVVIVDNHSSAGGYGTSGSATAFLDAHDFTATNLTFDNDYDYAASPSQAVAVNLTADRSVFTNVRFLGHQDTLLVNDGARSYFRSSYVEGTVDFIFGGGIAVFDTCQIHQLGSGGNITAASTPTTSAYGYLFYKSNIYGDSTGNGSLGRPWRQSAQVLYRESTIGAFVKTSQPWTNMSTNTWQAARFSEYKNTGAGATTNSNRPQLSDSQAASYTPAKYLAGSDGWNPTS